MLVESYSYENCVVRERIRIVRKQTVICKTTINRFEFTFDSTIMKNYLVSRLPDTIMPQYGVVCLGKESVVCCREAKTRESDVCLEI